MPSLLNVSTVRRLFPLRTLTADAEDLYGYGHSKIGMAGTITFAVRYGTKALPAFTFQVSHQGANLMGFDLFCELGFTLVDNSGAAILSVGSPWHQRWPALFSGLGCLTAFDHQPLLKPEFVGFRLTADGLSPLHSNVEAVLRLPEPSCPAQISSFLGMTAYYLRFLPQYSSTTSPLRELLKQDANVVADLLSRATPTPAHGAGPDATESELILMLHAPLQAAVSLEDLRLASEEDPTLSLLRTYIREGWPASSRRSWRLFIGSRTS
ncbi:hypothetical protein F7725_028277 [Dissostichus mawsoni]|uniref:Uncharacterized protein n=1 Tax=Dissostichus mawsoni TaxID=36200 RepID=A0A7J5XGH2_DISMA|nr:hypothetical protein F7725_028277 [Dissostichus mawsoni]